MLIERERKRESEGEGERARDYLPPISIIIMVKTFSAVVFADTLPNPTEVRLVNVKYNAVE